MIKKIKELKCKNCKYNLVFNSSSYCIKPKNGLCSMNKLKFFCIKKMEDFNEKDRRNFK